jgi:DNA-binding XRE family transcriptional regulator
MSDYKSLIGSNIASLRRKNCLTQAELAVMLHVSSKAVSKWETGHGLPDITLLPQIAKIFNVSIDQIFQ